MYCDKVRPLPCHGARTPARRGAGPRIAIGKLGAEGLGERAGFYMIEPIWPESELVTLLSNLATQPLTAQATSSGCQC